MTGDYNDIIYLPHHVSPTRPQMSMRDRAAQFSPFAALTGYDAAIRETARLTQERVELDEQELAVLDRKFQLLLEQLGRCPQVTITWFVPDELKQGGRYLTITDVVKKVDAAARFVLLQNAGRICMDDIVEIEGELFDYLE